MMPNRRPTPSSPVHTPRLCRDNSSRRTLGMRLRPIATFVPVSLVLVLSLTGLAFAAQRAEIDRGLRALEAGEPVPVANRPLDRSDRLEARVHGRAYVHEARAYVEPHEFGVLF